MMQNDAAHLAFKWRKHRKSHMTRNNRKIYNMMQRILLLNGVSIVLFVNS